MNRRFRLNKRTDFERVRRIGKSYAHPLIVLVALPNDLSVTRIGVSASRSVGGAVQRNRAKRRIRGSLAPLMAQIRTGFDLVFIARSTIGSSSAEDLTNAIDSVIRRARILANSGK